MIEPIAGVFVAGLVTWAMGRWQLSTATDRDAEDAAEWVLALGLLTSVWGAIGLFAEWWFRFASLLMGVSR